MPNFQGVWDLATQYENVASWPSPPATVYGMFFGGYGANSGNPKINNQINFSSLGNATLTGELSVQRAFAAQGSSTRAVISSFRNSANAGINLIEYVTFATNGDGVDFGDLTVARWAGGCVGNKTRAVFCGGFPVSGPSSNVLDYITIATTGNATDFGDALSGEGNGGAVSSPTRGVMKIGSTNVLEYITTATTGNSTDFGDTTSTYYAPMGASSSTRGLFAGGMKIPSYAYRIEIDYITIATTGNAIDFGDMTVARQNYNSGASDSTIAVFAGGVDVNSMEKVTIASLGNGIDFGDLTVGCNVTGTSSGHGGLQ